MTADKFILMLLLVGLATSVGAAMNIGVADLANQIFDADTISAKWITNEYYKGAE